MITYVHFRFGLVPAEPLQVQPINPNQSTSVTLACRTNGPVLKMEPLNNLQVYFCTVYKLVKIFCV